MSQGICSVFGVLEVVFRLICVNLISCLFFLFPLLLQILENLIP